MRKIQCYGWIPDLPDKRDLKYSVPRDVMASLPSEVDLRPNCPPVYDQGKLGSCTGNAIAGAHQFEQIKQVADKAFIPSRLMIYYDERVIENTVNSDSGAQIRDGIKTVVDLGVCPEDMWTYDINKFTDKPTDDCYAEGLKHQVTSYLSVSQTESQLKGCLADGYPFVFGFSVYERFESSDVAKTGVLNMPGFFEHQIGGHAVMCVGYDDVSQRFIVRNSWGSGWGMSGYFTMPYTYMTDSDLAADFWTIKLVEEV
jgi:C1A family cysteine protease